MTLISPRHRLSLAISLLSALALAPAVEAEPLRDRANDLFNPVPASGNSAADGKLNPDQVELGKMLFFEPRISASHLISCNTCHNVGFGGHDYLPTSIGHGWQRGPRNSPTVFNAVFNAAQFWDGRAADLAEQAKGPVQASVEMSSTPARVTATLNSMPEYVERFQTAFPDAAEPVSFDNMALAIEAFETTLTTPGSAFDAYLNGDAAALTAQQKAGLGLFMDKGCAACHTGVNLGGQHYFPFGLIARPGADILPVGDKGRFAVTRTASDEYVFRAAPLRNVALTAPYFHSGAVWSLEEAVAIMGRSQLGAELDAEEVSQITAFLESLTGEQPHIEYPLLPPSTADTPRPDPLWKPTAGH